MVIEVTALSAQVASLTSMVKNLVTASQNNQATQAAVTVPVTTDQQVFQAEAVSCVYCGGDHLFDNCFGNPASVNYVGNNRNFNPFSNTYNPGTKFHPAFSWSNNNAAAGSSNFPARNMNPPPGFHTQGQRTQQQQQISGNQEMSMEAMMKAFLSETKAQIQNQGVSIRNMETQVEQIAQALNARQNDALPTSTETPNASSSTGKEQCKAIHLRSGTELPAVVEKKKRPEDDVSGSEVVTTKGKANDARPGPDVVPDTFPRLVPKVPPPPFPQRLRKVQQDEKFNKFLDTKKQFLKDQAAKTDAVTLTENDESNKDSLEIVESKQVQPRWARRFESLDVNDTTFKVNEPSIVKPPDLELQQLPAHSKYVYLGELETLPVIISACLTYAQEGSLVSTLNMHQKDIGWKMIDIKGISPIMRMHSIFLDDNAKNSFERQGRLYPIMKEGVKKEIIKWPFARKHFITKVVYS